MKNVFVFAAIIATTLTGYIDKDGHYVPNPCLSQTEQVAETK